MKSTTNAVRRSTRDIDLDFIHYPLSDDAILIMTRKQKITAFIRGVWLSIAHREERCTYMIWWI